VTVVAYGKEYPTDTEMPWKVIRVARTGGPILRWWRYAKVLKKEAETAHIIYAFSAVSCGIPLWMARVKNPLKILRLGGDFLWERYTDMGGRRGLREFYKRYCFFTPLLARILRQFDHIVFSTSFQEMIYRRAYRNLPKHSVIENALLESERVPHVRHTPLRLLFLGRFVRFKNLPSLLAAVELLPHSELTLVGGGPMTAKASALAQKLGLHGRVKFLPSMHGEQKAQLFREHDVLVLPSLTEISPHTALEARAAGLPVLLTSENGLSEAMRDGMIICNLKKSDDIVRAVIDIDQRYEEAAIEAQKPIAKRTWSAVAEEHLALFHSLLRNPDIV
jgi:glycosyltransferase involved in cell wall biosynthesis